jgi:hypothetical protein
MLANASVTDPTRSAVVSSRDVRADDAAASDDGCSGSGSDQEEDYEDVSTGQVPQISTGVLHLGGAPSNIHMENSSDVHIGSRLNYNAPVTINQCVHVLKNDDVQNGVMLREAIQGPVHVLDPNQNTSSQGKGPASVRRALQVLVVSEGNLPRCAGGNEFRSRRDYWQFWPSSTDFLICSRKFLPSLLKYSCFGVAPVMLEQ